MEVRVKLKDRSMEVRALNNKHKYSQYFGWGITAFAVIAAGILFYFGIDYMGKLFDTVGSFLRILSPFIWGLVISYLLMPSMAMYEEKFFKPLIAKLRTKHPKLKISEKLSRVLAVTLAEIVLVIIIGALIYLIVPQVYDSIATIIANSPSYFDSAYSAIDNLLRDYPVIEEYATKIFGNITEALTRWVSTTVLPGMESLVTNITTGVYYVLKAVYNVVIGIIVSVYILYNREAFRAHYKKFMYSIFSPKTAMKVNSAFKFADKTFMGFITGKLLDSAIIGVICYIGCLALNLPYALLIAVIVGVTNIIPFFGPFIGAIPSALLILLVDPKMCLWFVIFIIVLQQIDGNIIGPKILGTSIGINGFWVLFSIILFGGLFGFWGMLLGVPAFVIIYTAVEILVNRKLEKDNIPTDTALYVDLDYIDPETGEMVKVEKSEKPENEPGKNE